MKVLVLFSLLFLSPIQAVLAHTHLEKTSPKDGAILDRSPTELTFQFSEPTRLTATKVQKEGEKQVVALKSTGKAPAAMLTVTLDSLLSPGKYVVSWRAVGPDNHVMSGKLHFTIASR